MGALLTPAEIAGTIQDTGGVLVEYGPETTYGHFEQVPVELVRGEGGGQLDANPSVVIALGTLTDIDHDSGIGERLIVDGEEWEIRDIVPGDADGATIRLMLT